jgi:hypothetical protein
MPTYAMRRTVRGPGGLAVACRTRGERALRSARDVDQPQVRAALVLHGVEERALVHDLLAVGREHRMVGPLQREHVHGLERGRRRLQQRRVGGEQQRERGGDGTHGRLLVYGRASMRAGPRGDNVWEVLGFVAIEWRLG